MKSSSRIQVRYAETDQMGVVHHSNYAIWYEQARTDLIKKLGITYTQMEEMGLIVPIIELQSKFISPAFYEDVLVVEVTLKSVTRVKLEFEYIIYREGENKAINIGRSVHALVKKDLRPTNIQKEFPELFKMLEEAVE